MPGFNGKGPEGQGPKTGRGMGKCNPENVKPDVHVDAENQPRGLGKGRGQGQRRHRGQGMGNGRGLGQGRQQ